MDLGIAIAQVKPFIGRPDKNIGRMREVIEGFRGDTPDLVIFPEMFLVGYPSRDLIYRLAEPIDGGNIRRILSLASEYGINIITGFPERDPRYDVIYNSALLASPDGEVKVYRKMHLPDFGVFDEWRYFRRWDGGIDVWRVKGVDIGVQICYDVFFPEVSRAYTYMGCKVLIAISATPDQSMPLFHTVCQARAIENTVYFIWVNMVGTFNGIGFSGGSRVIEPLGKVILDMPTMVESIDGCRLDMYRLRIAREKRPILKDVHLADLMILNDGYRLNKMGDNR